MIVNLGAGLCTRYDRLDRPAVDWIEIDFPDVIALRRALLPETSNHRAIACSVTDHSWLEQIPSLLEAPPLFIAEGLLMYIPDSEVRRLLIALQRRFPGCKLLADTVSPLVSALYARHPILGDTGMRWHRRTLGSQRQLDRWSSGILLENMWFPTDHHPERWGRTAALWYVPFLRNVAKVRAAPPRRPADIGRTRSFDRFLSAAPRSGAVNPVARDQSPLQLCRLGDAAEERSILRYFAPQQEHSHVRRTSGSTMVT
jgi:hypothetical protein